MSYICEISINLSSTFPTWSFLNLTLILILGALISFITRASFGIIVNWVLDFYQSIFHSNLQRTYPLEVTHLVWVLQSCLTTVFDELIQFLRRWIKIKLFCLFLLLLIVSLLVLTPPLLVALFKIDDTLDYWNSAIWKWEGTSRFSYIFCWFFYYLYSWDPTIS